ncbi:glycosyltransferase involved in cell wall biosynthesis [Pseudomonas nitritireducens]|uniref:Glycosyltransferase involved in cell wall biosynthesis n=1 Tax=Pseudomonas nitroreducens TaxID=46680 RepID=A0A7W7KN24_PSENT|nr:glycosyltransferase family 4 protein [Pseudomonas nitritireducens]MBB4865098.1 glycosyltransferase involved in cell wall biosynthesis [Pseudomonas nitritireducens]
MIVWNEFRNDARVLKEAQTLQGAGYQVQVFALHTPGITCQRETLSDGIRVLRVPRSPFWTWRKVSEGAPHRASGMAGQGQLQVSALKLSLRVVARIWTHMQLLLQMIRYQPDVVHGHDVNTLPTAWLAAWFSRAHLIYDAHEISTSREGYNSFRQVVGWIEKRLAPRADGMITTTQARAKFFARAYGVPRPLVLQNRPRFSEWQPSGRIRRELGFDQPWPIVVYQGGLQQGRGLHKLVKAAGSVPNTYFVLIGGGRLTRSLGELADSLGINDRVRFIPTVALADLPEYTASADIGVQPIDNTCLNHFTTDSNKLFEYLIGGLPVIATNLPEIRSIVRQYQVGLLVPDLSLDALVEALRKLSADLPYRAELARNAKEAAKVLNWEAQESLLVSLYGGLFAAMDVKVSSDS